MPGTATESAHVRMARAEATQLSFAAVDLRS
jgi:hypothetical protein